MKTVSAALLAVVALCASVQTIPAAEIITFKEKVVYSFGGRPDGGYPYDGVIDVNGELYGTTADGGGSGAGSVFAVNRATHTETLVYSFVAGEYPHAGLLDLNGEFYGTTSGSDSYGGILFAIDPGTGQETTVHKFCSQIGCQDGGYPKAGVIDVDGILYGTASGGGNVGVKGCNNTGCGTVFSVNPSTGTGVVLHFFCNARKCADGATPDAPLIDVNGTLYGTTLSGGTNDNGTVFSVNPNTGKEAAIHSFCSQPNCGDGASPAAGLLDVSGILYGTTGYGGGTGCGGLGCGTVFSLDLGTDIETVLYSFCAQQKCADDSVPAAALIEANGLLYGTTQDGGAQGQGTVFSLDPRTGIETVLYSFCVQRFCADGQTPSASLIAENGKFYGTTTNGGAHGAGTVFELQKER